MKKGGKFSKRAFAELMNLENDCNSIASSSLQPQLFSCSDLKIRISVLFSSIWHNIDGEKLFTERTINKYIYIRLYTCIFSGEDFIRNRLKKFVVLFRFSLYTPTWIFNNDSGFFFSNNFWKSWDIFASTVSHISICEDVISSWR